MVTGEFLGYCFKKAAIYMLQNACKCQVIQQNRYKNKLGKIDNKSILILQPSTNYHTLYVDMYVFIYTVKPILSALPPPSIKSWECNKHFSIISPY